MTDLSLAQARRAYAEELRHVAHLDDERVVAAFASVPRERFVGPGPWHLLDMSEGYWQTPDSDPRRLYHNVLVALVPEKKLNTGEPSLWARHFDRLKIREGDRILQIGSGTGYFTAILAELVGAAGRVQAIEIDPQLAAQAAANVVPWPQADVKEGNGLADADGGPWNEIIAFAGVPAPVEAWHQLLAIGGRAFYPLTTEKGGIMLRVERLGDGWSAEARGRAWFYPCIGSQAKDDIASLQHAFERLDFGFIRSLRHDRHDADGSCWLHGEGWCLSCRDPA
jgi:protein-L-isoaspartate(D-aspartate) O-methyltransferase